MATNKYLPDENGFYGEFGGAYIPELLRYNIDFLKENYKKIIFNPDFQLLPAMYLNIIYIHF